MLVSTVLIFDERRYLTLRPNRVGRAGIDFTHIRRVLSRYFLSDLGFDSCPPQYRARYAGTTVVCALPVAEDT